MAQSSNFGARRRARTPDGQPERISLYDEVTAKIITQLEEGRFPWVQPWASCEDMATDRLASGLRRGRA